MQDTSRDEFNLDQPTKRPYISKSHQKHDSVNSLEINTDDHIYLETIGTGSGGNFLDIEQRQSTTQLMNEGSTFDNGPG
jgi:hypothetical protein